MDKKNDKSDPRARIVLADRREPVCIGAVDECVAGIKMHRAFQRNKPPAELWPLGAFALEDNGGDPDV